MSGIYISGMEMPKSCAFCKIKRRNGKKMVCPLCGEEWDVHDPMSADHRLDTCPLVPVPTPHGRLGDMDKLESGLRHMAKFQHGERQQGILGCCETIRLAPAIIEADPAEEDET